MAKKKTKVVSNRGYATISAPSKKIEHVAPPPVAEVEPKPIKPQEIVPEHPFESLTIADKSEEDDQDPVSKLVKKFESLNDHKAQTALDRMLKDDLQQQNVPEDRIKQFRLTAEVEKDLLQVIKHKDSDISGKQYSRALY
jgi:ATP-dependent RNA helicase DHX29